MVDGVKVDLGAYEVSILENIPPKVLPFTEMLKKKAINLDQQIKQSETIYVDGHGQPFSEEDHEVVEGCIEELTELIKGKVLQKKVESYYESGKELIDQLMDEGCGKLTPQQRKLFCLELQMIEEEEAGSIHTMCNAISCTEDLDEEGIDQYPLPEHGYHKLLETFAEDLPKESIKLNTKVIRISRENGMVSIHTKNQLGQSSTYQCKKVICTIP